MHVDDLGLTRTMPAAPTPPLQHHPRYISLLTRRLLACFLSPPTSRTSSDQLLFRFWGHLNHTRILSSLTPIIPLISALALLPLILMYHIPTLILTIRTPRILQVKRRQLMPFHALYIIESLVTRTFYISPLYFFCTYFNTHNVSYAIPTSIIVLNFRGCHSSCKRNPRHDANAMRGLKWQCDMS